MTQEARDIASLLVASRVPARPAKPSRPGKYRQYDYTGANDRAAGKRRVRRWLDSPPGTKYSDIPYDQEVT
jgi:hypothetical protein